MVEQETGGPTWLADVSSSSENVSTSKSLNKYIPLNYLDNVDMINSRNDKLRLTKHKHEDLFKSFYNLLLREKDKTWLHEHHRLQSKRQFLNNSNVDTNLLTTLNLKASNANNDKWTTYIPYLNESAKSKEGSIAIPEEERKYSVEASYIYIEPTLYTSVSF